MQTALSGAELGSKGRRQRREYEGGSFWLLRDERRLRIAFPGSLVTNEENFRPYDYIYLQTRQGHLFKSIERSYEPHYTGHINGSYHLFLVSFRTLHRAVWALHQAASSQLDFRNPPSQPSES